MAAPAGRCGVHSHNFWAPGRGKRDKPIPFQIPTIKFRHKMERWARKRLANKNRKLQKADKKD